MKFLFDANVPKKAQSAVRTVFTGHQFVAVWEPPFDPDMDDLALFELAKSEKIDAVITHDVVQMVGLDRRHERGRCADCGLHWLGMPQPYKVHGPLRKSAHIASGLIHALADVIDVFEAASAPTAILLSEVSSKPGFERGYPQLVDSG